MGGIDSEGVEIAFPIAPNAILVMVDDNYHSLQIYDLAFIPMDEEAVECYNTMQVARAERCLFSPTNDFSVVDRVLSKHPDLFDTPSMSLSWGGKVFYPKERGVILSAENGSVRVIPNRNGIPALGANSPAARPAPTSVSMSSSCTSIGKRMKR